MGRRRAGRAFWVLVPSCSGVAGEEGTLCAKVPIKNGDLVGRSVLSPAAFHYAGGLAFSSSFAARHARQLRLA
jgi:hypothetical protein